MDVLDIYIKLLLIQNTLDKKLGDSDPFIEEEMTDDDIREEEPVFWCHKEIVRLIDNIMVR